MMASMYVVSRFEDNRNIIEHITEMGKHAVICYVHEDIVPEILYKVTLNCIFRYKFYY